MIGWNPEMGRVQSIQGTRAEWTKACYRQIEENVVQLDHVVFVSKK